MTRTTVPTAAVRGGRPESSRHTIRSAAPTGPLLAKIGLLGLAQAVVVLALARPALAQEWAGRMFEVTSHDFGTIVRGAKAEFAFELTNPYPESVRIAGVRSNCGCSTPRVETDTIPPRQTGAVIARINSQAFLGNQRATITVSFDEPLHAEVQLHVKVYVYRDVLIEPAAVTLGTVPLGAAAEQTVTVRHAGRDDWRLVGVRSDHPHLVATLTQSQRFGGRATYALRVVLDGRAPAGYIREHLWLETNDPQAERLPVLVEGRVLPPVAVSPGALSFGVVRPGETVARQIVVRSPQPFRITAVHASGDGVRANVPSGDEAKPLHLVGLSFTAGAEPGMVARTIVIETDSAEPVELPAHAVIGGSGPSALP